MMHCGIEPSKESVESSSFWFYFHTILRHTRMPLYFLLSGLFFKTYGGFADFSLRKVNKLLVPLIFFNAIYIAIRLVLLTITGFGDKSWFEYMSPTWFLIALFSLNVIFYLLFIISNSLFQSSKSKMVGLFFLSLITGLSGLAIGETDKPLSYFCCSLTVTPFFFLGYFLKNATDYFYQKSVSAKDIGYLLLLVLLSLTVLFFRSSDGITKLGFATNNVLMPSVVYYFGSVGVLTILVLSKILYHYFQFSKSFVVSYVGRYSVVVLCTHYIILFAFHSIMKSMNIDVMLRRGIIFTSIIVLEYFVVIPLCVKYLPKFCAQEDLIPLSILKKSVEKDGK